MTWLRTHPQPAGCQPTSNRSRPCPATHMRFSRLVPLVLLMMAGLGLGSPPAAAHVATLEIVAVVRSGNPACNVTPTHAIIHGTHQPVGIESAGEWLFVLEFQHFPVQGSLVCIAGNPTVFFGVWSENTGGCVDSFGSDYLCISAVVPEGQLVFVTLSWCEFHWGCYSGTGSAFKADQLG